jgi:hypothetical protein
MQANPAERIFFQEGSVLVTDARVVVERTTYPLRNITSVRSDGESLSRPGITFGIGGSLLGGLVSMSAASDLMSGWRDEAVMLRAVLGLLVVAACATVVWLSSRKPKAQYWVIIITASGEARAICSHDSLWIVKIVRAINDALVARQ